MLVENDSKRNCTLLSVPPLMSFAGRKTLEASILSTPKSSVLYTSYEVSVCLFVFVLFLCLFVCCFVVVWGRGCFFVVFFFLGGGGCGFCERYTPSSPHPTPGPLHLPPKNRFPSHHSLAVPWRKAFFFVCLFVFCFCCFVCEFFFACLFVCLGVFLLLLFCFVLGVCLFVCLLVCLWLLLVGVVAVVVLLLLLLVGVVAVVVAVVPFPTVSVPNRSSRLRGR